MTERTGRLTGPNQAGRRSRTRQAAGLAAALLVQLGLAAAALATDAGWVAGINGAPTITRAGKTEPLKRGDAVRVGDRIDTGEATKVKVLLADDSVLAIGPRTQLTIDELALGGDRRKGRLRVLFGRFKLAIADWLNGPSDYQVDTPTAVAGVRGTVLWGDTQLDTICALRGHVEVRTVRGDATTTLEAGHCVTDMGKGEVVPIVPSREDLDKYLREVTLD
jgi:hypothetical protein